VSKRVKILLIIGGLILARAPIAILGEHLSTTMYVMATASWFALCAYVYALNRNTLAYKNKPSADEPPPLLPYINKYYSDEPPPLSIRNDD